MACMRSLALGVALAALLSGAAEAASFDCSKPSTKLYRAICADPELSRLDEQVWNAYGERIKTLSPAQYEQVRDRHITWRRQRGRYDRGMVQLADDYRRHLAWLQHPLLPLEGRYARADGAEVDIEIDLQAPAEAPALIAIGRLGNLQWLPAQAGLPANSLRSDLGTAAPQPSTVLQEGSLHLVPDFVGTPTLPIQACDFTLDWSGDTLRLHASGSCGADFSGDYAMQPPAHPWPHIVRPTPAASTPAP
jgi:hypothetical protein